MAIVTAHVAAVQELYVAYFGRPADTAGLDYWTNVVQANAGATAAVSAAFAASPEYIVTYFGQTNVQIVNNIYQNLFGRDADAAGSAYWANLLTNGTIKVDTIVAEVANAALTTDAEAVENKVAASTAFTAALDTTAENAGYAGNSALTLAKAFIKSVTTDATLATAIAPANLNAQVAAVVKAGTPFSLTSSLAALETAGDSLADFLEDNDLPAISADAKIVVDAAVVTETADVGALITVGNYVAGSAAVKTALLADQQRANNTALTSANTALTAANAEAATVTGLPAAIANLRAAVIADEEARELAIETQTDLNVATSTFNLRNEFPAVIAPNGTATVDGEALLVLNTRGQLVVAAGVTEADFPGVTSLRDAIIADKDADLDASLAAQALLDAQNEDLVDDNGALVTAVLNASALVETREEAITTLAEAVADRTEALALQTQFTAAVKAVTDAQAAFGLNGYATPVELDGASFAATSGSDIFLIGTEETVTISSFGRSGTDSLFIGSNYVVNTAGIDAGVDTALEVFFVQNGSRTEVHVEQAPYGSSSDDVTIVTLVGVDADDLQLVNGIISLKATAA